MGGFFYALATDSAVSSQFGNPKFTLAITASRSAAFVTQPFAASPSSPFWHQCVIT
jgi:hypothetical protein